MLAGYTLGACSNFRLVQDMSTFTECIKDSDVIYRIYTPTCDNCSGSLGSLGKSTRPNPLCMYSYSSLESQAAESLPLSRLAAKVVECCIATRFSFSPLSTQP